MSDNRRYTILTHHPCKREEVNEGKRDQFSVFNKKKGGGGMSDRMFFYDDISYVVSEAFREYFGKSVQFVERASDYGSS